NRVPVDIFGPGWGHVDQSSQNSAGEKKSKVYLGRRHHCPGSVVSYLQAIQQRFRSDGWRAPKRLLQQWRFREENKRLIAGLGPVAKGAIPFTQIAQVFAAYEVCLNFSNVWADGIAGSELIPHVRLRDFEGPMCRTCYLTGQTDEITE